MPASNVNRPADLREQNVRVLFERLATHGAATRSELARSTSLSPASISRVVDDLTGAGLVRAAGRVGNGVGRPSTRVAVDAGAASVFGASVRSAGLRMVLADLRGRPLARERQPRPIDSPAALVREVRSALDGLVRDAENAGPIAAGAVGIVGVWGGRGNGLYAAPTVPALEGHDLASDLEQALGNRVLGEVHVENDVKLAAIGDGVEAGGHDGSRFYLGLGSGVGGAVVQNGSVVRGAHGFAGEIGFVPVRDGPRRVPLAHVLGRAAWIAWYRQLGVDKNRAEAWSLAPEAVDDPALRAAALRRASEALTDALVAVTAMIDPDRIQIGGPNAASVREVLDDALNEVAGLVPRVPDVSIVERGHDASLAGAIAAALPLGRRALLDRAFTPT